MDTEVGSSLEDEYSVTCVAVQAAWYSLCVILSRGGAIARSDGGRIFWVASWVYVRGFFGCGLVNGVYLGYCDGIFLGWQLGVRLGQYMEGSWEILDWTLPD